MEYTLTPCPIFRDQLIVTMTRSPVGGVSCTYTGTYKKRDVHNALPYRVSGSYSCTNGYTGPWRANIR